MRTVKMIPIMLLAFFVMVGTVNSQSLELGMGNFALQLDGDSFVEIADTETPNVGNTGTLAGWVRPDFAGPSGFASNFVFHHNTGAEDRLYVGMRTGANNAFRIALAETVVDLSTANPNGTWVHFSLTWDNGTYQFYRNGQFVQSGSYSGTVNTENGPWNIGRSSGSPASGRFFDGQADDFRLYSRVLSATEIEEISNERYLENTTDQVAWYQMNEGRSGTAPGSADLLDSSGSGLHMVNNDGLAKWYTEALLTGPEAGWRFISAPMGVSYGELFENIWTQGAIGSDNNDPGVTPNVYVWDSTASGISNSNWVPVTDLTAIPAPGTGIYIYVFEENEWDGSNFVGGFPHILTAAGEDFEFDTNGDVFEVNSNNNSWGLIGNPVGTMLDFNQFDFSNVNQVMYIWDANDGDNYRDEAPADVAGSWLSYSTGGTPVASGLGDITNGIIAPFQAFFVQTTAANGSVRIGEDARTENDADFYGRQLANNTLRIQVSNEFMGNSTWINFNEEGSMSKTPFDAYQLEPVSDNYTMLAGKKTNGLFDISILPIPEVGFEFPLHMEATKEGMYEFKVTDFDVELDVTLILEDRLTGESFELVEGATFEFMLEEAVETNSSIDSKGDLQMVQKPIVAERSFAKLDERFVLTAAVPTSVDNPSDLPKQIALNQNYPNPFNPSTLISYSLPEQHNVRLEVYDMLGRRVALLVDERQSAGNYQVTWDASAVSSGVYVYRLQAGGQTFTRQMTLVK